MSTVKQFDEISRILNEAALEDNQIGYIRDSLIKAVSDRSITLSVATKVAYEETKSASNMETIKDTLYETMAKQMVSLMKGNEKVCLRSVQNGDIVNFELKISVIDLA